MTTQQAENTTHMSDDGRWLCITEACDGIHHYFVKP